MASEEVAAAGADLCEIVRLTKERDEAQERYVSVIKANAEVAVLNAELQEALIHGLGLANELGEGERWAEWRVFAHATLNAEHPRVPPAAQHLAEVLAELKAALSTIDGIRRAMDLMRQALKLAGADNAALLQALKLAAPFACSMLCPSVKKTGDEWTHVATCQAITEQIDAEHSGAQLLADLDVAAERARFFESDRDAALRALQAEKDDRKELEQVLDVAYKELEGWRPHAITLARQLGRCDMAFEIILGLRSAAACHRTARRMRDELKRPTGHVDIGVVKEQAK